MKSLQRKIFLVVIFGYLTCTVISKSFSEDEYDGDDRMQADDYDYDSDDISSSTQPNRTMNSNSEPRKVYRNANVTAELGNSFTLYCDVKGEVILWYKDGNLISTGKNIVSPMHTLDPNSFALTINNATKDSLGDYYCQVHPQNVRVYTKVSHTTENDLPTSSKSSHAVLSAFIFVASCIRTMYKC